MSATATISPMQILLPYQRRWVEDGARFKIGLWARQTGKSFACACEAVRDCLVRPGQLWVCLSAGERQALEFVEKAKQWARAFEMAFSGHEELRDGAEAVLKAAEIRFRNGSRIIALPANPNTARGYSANLVLDEFAFHEDPDAIWRAIYPSISNPLRGEKLLRIVSTPNGRGNKFYDIWTKSEAYSKHRVTIHDAIAEGLQVDADSLKAGLDDPEAWAQEYECEFVDEGGVLLPYEMIAACEHEEAGRPDRGGDGARYVGVDIGRKHDLTVIWVAERVGDVLWTREVAELRHCPFDAQEAAIAERARTSARCAIDATGIGAMLAERLRTRFGYRIEPWTITMQSKGDLMLGLRRAMEERRVRIPISRAVREDLHSLQKVVTSGGSIRYSAERSADGHADRAFALALAIAAATEQGRQGIYW